MTTLTLYREPVDEWAQSLTKLRDIHFCEPACDAFARISTMYLNRSAKLPSEHISQDLLDAGHGRCMRVVERSLHRRE